MELNFDPSDRKPHIVVVGGGVHAVVVVDCIRATKLGIVTGYVDRSAHSSANMCRIAVPWFGEDAALSQRFDRGLVDAAILGIAGIDHVELRRRLVAELSCRMHRWWTAIHPTAVVAEGVPVGGGTVILARAAVNPLARIGEHVVINTGAVIEHHVTVGNFAVISPNATICGCARIGESAFIGAGATILTNISIGERAVVGAGAVVLRDVPDGAVVVGNPARLIERAALPRPKREAIPA